MPQIIRVPTIPTFAPKYSQENLLKIAGTREFDRGFRQRAISPGELMFPSFQTCYNPGLLVTDVMKRNFPTYLGLDLSSPQRPGNVIVALQMDPNTQMRYPVHVRSGAWTSPETVENLGQVCRMFGWIEFIMVENNAYQQSLIDWIKAMPPASRLPHWQRIEALTTGRQKHDPRFGVPGLEVEFKNRSWAIPSSEWAGHESTCACDWCRWRREFLLYPRGSSTDAVMATWFAIFAIMNWGMRVVATTGRPGSVASILDR